MTPKSRGQVTLAVTAAIVGGLVTIAVAHFTVVGRFATRQELNKLEEKTVNKEMYIREVQDLREDLKEIKHGVEELNKFLREE